MAENPELAVFVGLPGSGKSTFYRTHLAGTHVLVSKDLMPNNRRPERRQRQLVEQALAEGRNVAVDNTSPAKADRAPLLEIAKQLGIRAIAYVFESDVKACIARNAARTGKAKVPLVAIFTARKRFESVDFSEGFAAIYEVRANEDGTFEVRERPASVPSSAAAAPAGPSPSAPQ